MASLGLAPTALNSMRGPTCEILQQTVALLVADVCKANGLNSCVGSDVMTLTRQLEAYRLAAVAIAAEIHAQSALLKQRLNQHTYIHKLPIELFSSILLKRVNDTERPKRLKQMQDLAGVCRHWKDVVLQTPQFWSDITFDNDGDYDLTMLRLRKSKQAPLKIQCGSATRTVRRVLANTPQMNGLIAEVAQRSDRMRSLLLNTAATPAVMNALSKPMPDLVDVWLCVDALTSTVVFPLAGEGCTLRTLHLQYVSAPWDSTRIANLTYLCLRHIDENSPSLRQISTILASSPALEKLILGDLEPQRNIPPEEIPEHLSDISLPNLACLSLEGLPTAMMRFLISSLRPAATCAVCIKCLHDRHISDGTLRSHLASLIAPSLRTTTEIHFTTRASANCIIVCATPWKMSTTSPGPFIDEPSPQPEVGAFMSIEVTRMDHALRNVANIIEETATTRPVCLTLAEPHVNPDLPGDSFPTDIFDHLHHLDALAIRGSNDAREILRQLSQPRLLPDGSQGWPCSNMTRLNLQGAMELEYNDIHQFKTSRWGEGQDSDGMTTRPGGLKEFRIPLTAVRTASF